MSLSLLLLGLLIGMRHATEADHLAAIATLTSRNQGLRSTFLQGAAWGLGHTFTLFVFTGLVLLLGGTVPAHYAKLLETAVGLMLIGLGLDVFCRFYRNRVHLHVHSHVDGVRHVHAHSHASRIAHDEDAHQHQHAKGVTRRALSIGLIHGMAGSASLIVLTTQHTHNIMTGLLYILLFGIGSILGMTLLSAAIIIPLRQLHSLGLTRIYNGAQCLIGTMTIGLGSMIVWGGVA